LKVFEKLMLESVSVTIKVDVWLTIYPMKMEPPLKSLETI